MDETKWTKGPWGVGKAIGQGDYAGLTPIGPLFESKLWPATRATALVAFVDFNILREATENAHLIAAAPDLYAALMMVCDEAVDQRGWDFNLSLEQWAIVRFALAKARGEPRPTKTEGGG